MPLLSAEGCHTQLDVQHCPLITYQGVFSRVDKPSDDINTNLFLMDKKGVRGLFGAATFLMHMLSLI
jgi:hypothetical protein